MNRKERRKAEKKGIIDKFDPETESRMKFSIELPPGLLRDGGKSSRSGQFTAKNEVDLTRGMFVKLLETFNFINQQQAVVGLFASVVNPFPKNMRGALAYAIINGTGLQIVEDEVEVCVFCEAEKLMTLDMSEDTEAPDWVADQCQDVGTDEESGVCGRAVDEVIHTAGKDDWLHDFDEPNPPMLDITQHAENCDARPLGKDESPLDRNIAAPQWKEITAVIVLTPVMYEPLNPPPTDEEQEALDDDTKEDEEPIDFAEKAAATPDVAVEEENNV